MDVVIIYVLYWFYHIILNIIMCMFIIIIMYMFIIIMYNGVFILILRLLIEFYILHFTQTINFLNFNNIVLVT